MTKQAELVMKLMTLGIPDNVQDVIGDKLQEYKGTDKSEEVASIVLSIIESPGDVADIIKKIKNVSL